MQSILQLVWTLINGYVSKMCCWLEANRVGPDQTAP